MRAESGFKGDVAARLEGLRDREGMRRLGAVLSWQDVKSAPNSNELVGFQGAIHQSVRRPARRRPPARADARRALSLSPRSMRCSVSVCTSHNSRSFQLLQVSGILETLAAASKGFGGSAQRIWISPRAGEPSRSHPLSPRHPRVYAAIDVPKAISSLSLLLPCPSHELHKARIVNARQHQLIANQEPRCSLQV